jgi:soluble lytic murein transglycosylase-like protein
VRALLAATALALVAVPCGADEPLRFYRDGDRVVITNVPTEGSRPLPGRSRTARVRGGSSLPSSPYDAFIERLATEYGLPAGLIKSVVLVESGFDPHARSPKGAQGLMQLMPETARQYGVRDAFDPLENLRAGTRHLRGLVDEFGGDVTLALAAYNAGAGAVRRHGGIPDYRETRDYVRRVHDSMGRPVRRGRPRPPAEPVRMERASDGSVRLVN